MYRLDWSEGLLMILISVLHKATHLTCHDITLHTDVGDIYNVTPLHKACINGQKDLVQYLVEELKCDVGECVGNCSRMRLHVTTKVCY